MANPFGMAEFSVPQLLGLDMQLKQNRLQQLYQQRQQAREDYTFERQKKNDADTDTEKAAYRNLFTPAGVAGVGDPAPGATAPAPTNLLPGAPAAPVAPVTDGTALAASPVAASPVAAPTSTGLFKPDPGRLRALAATGPTGFAAAQAIMKMNAEQVKQAQESVTRMLDTKARVIGGIRALPPEQRAAAYQQERTMLIQNGASETDLPPVWDEDKANQMIREGLTAAEALGMDQKAKEFAHQVQHDNATEANAAGNLGVARGNLAVRQGALAAAKKPGANTSTADLLKAAGLGN